MAPIFVAATAWGDIYSWTDAKGNLNFSNVPPLPADKVKKVKVVAQESSATAAAVQPPTPAEQELLARIKNLERQLQAQQRAAQAPPPVPPAPVAPRPPAYGGYYQSPPPMQAPPPQPYYDNGYDYGYAPAYYPGYYYPAPVYAVYPARAYFARPGFGPRGSFNGGFGGGRGGGGLGGRR